jgi:hypothetical protein
MASPILLFAPDPDLRESSTKTLADRGIDALPVTSSDELMSWLESKKPEELTVFVTAQVDSPEVRTLIERIMGYRPRPFRALLITSLDGMSRCHYIACMRMPPAPDWLPRT